MSNLTILAAKADCSFRKIALNSLKNSLLNSSSTELPPFWNYTAPRQPVFSRSRFGCRQSPTAHLSLSLSDSDGDWVPNFDKHDLNLTAAERKRPDTHIHTKYVRRLHRTSSECTRNKHGLRPRPPKYRFWFMRKFGNGRGTNWKLHFESGFV